jgi:hypothetical protein
MRGVFISLILILSTGTALADRPLTQEENERLQAALKEQGCSGGKMEFDDGKFEVDDTRCVDGKTVQLRTRHRPARLVWPQSGPHAEWHLRGFPELRNHPAEADGAHGCSPLT